MSGSSFKQITIAAARRIVVIVVGSTLAVVGVVFVFTPGPAVVVLSLALGVFAIEFAWARRWLRKLKESARAVLPGEREEESSHPDGSPAGDTEKTR